MGYTKKVQPNEGAPIVKIGGIAVSGNQPEVIDAIPSPATKIDMGTNDGDNPSMPTDVPFATGTDNRVKGSPGGNDPYAGE